MPLNTNQARQSSRFRCLSCLFFSVRPSVYWVTQDDSKNSCGRTSVKFSASACVGVNSKEPNFWQWSGWHSGILRNVGGSHAVSLFSRLQRVSKSEDMIMYEAYYTQLIIRNHIRSYQSVDEVIAFEFDSFDGVKDVDLAVERHLFTDDPAGAEQSALAGAVNAVHDYRRCAASAGGALCRTLLNHLYQLYQVVASRRHLASRTHLYMPTSQCSGLKQTFQQSAMQMNGCTHLVPLYPYHATNYSYYNRYYFQLCTLICLRFQSSLQSNQT